MCFGATIIPFSTLELLVFSRIVIVISIYVMGLIIAVSGVTAEMDTLHIMAFLSFLRVLIDHTVNVYALIL